MSQHPDVVPTLIDLPASQWLPIIAKLLSTLQAVAAKLDLNAPSEHRSRKAVRAKAAYEIVGLGRSNFFARQNPKDAAWDPTFPRSFKLGTTPNSPTVWFVDELEAWLEQRAASRLH